MKAFPVKFNKVDQSGNPVSGAKLEIRKESATGTKVEGWTTDGKVKTFELVDGIYYLVETEVPKDYALAEPVKFEVKDGKLFVNGTEREDVTVTMVDTNLTALPTAGGSGTMMFFLIGMILMVAAVVFGFRRKRI